MPDTPEHQAAYPQNVSQKPGLGFPIARIAALFSLSCGAVVDLGICRYAGKGQSELGMLRKMESVATLLGIGSDMLSIFPYFPGPIFIKEDEYVWTRSIRCRSDRGDHAC
jgi:hypothetical protein